jgi:hypothetical protein
MPPFLSPPGGQLFRSGKTIERHLLRSPGKPLGLGY